MKYKDDVESSDDSIEGADEFGESEVFDSIKSTRPRLRKWQKVSLLITIAIVVILVFGLSTFSVLRLRWLNSLKEEEQTTLYGGKEYRYRSELINILCLGVDKDLSLEQMQAGRDNLGMTDTILLVSVDTKKHKAKIISIPRDTIAEVQLTTDKGGLAEKEKMQICYQYAYGISVEQCNELTVKAVSRLLYNIPIQKYCTFNFQVVPILNDAVGGVDVVVDEHIEEWGTGYTYGENMHLEGEVALQYLRARDRKNVNGSFLRSQRQKQYAVSFIRKAKSVFVKNPSLPFELFGELQKDGNVYTNLTVEDIIYLMPEALGITFQDGMMQVLQGESTLGEDGFAEFYMDVDSLKQLIIDTFYEAV